MCAPEACNGVETLSIWRRELNDVRSYPQKSVCHEATSIGRRKHVSTFRNYAFRPTDDVSRHCQKNPETYTRVHLKLYDLRKESWTELVFH